MSALQEQRNQPAAYVPGSTGDKSFHGAGQDSIALGSFMVGPPLPACRVYSWSI
jgi:hypothetical protein